MNDVLFDESGAPVAVAKVPAPTPEATLQDILSEFGMPLEQLEPATAEILKFTQERAIVLSCEGIREIMLALDGTPAGECLRRAVLGHRGESLSTVAQRAGCTRERIHALTSRITRRLLGIHNNPINRK